MRGPIAAGSLFDAPEPGVITAALDWCLGLVSGSLVTVIATIAVAGLGFALLAGRLPVRRGILIVLGIFMVSSAALISESHKGQLTADGPVSAPPAQPIKYSPATQQDGQPPTAYDPYAGASVVRR